VQQNALSQQAATEGWLAEGKKQIAAGKFSDAVASFKQIKKVAPLDPRPYFFSGIALAEAGNLSSAASELNEAVRLAPGQPEFVLSQANVLTRLGQKNLAVKALAIFEKEELASQLTTPGLWLLFEVYGRLGMNEDALRMLEVLTKRSQQDPRINLERGRIYKAIGNLDLAQECFQDSIKESAENARAYFELGKVLEQRNETLASKKALLEAVRLDGSNVEYLHELGSVCLTLNEVDEALQYLEKAEPFGLTFPKIYYTLGQAYQRKGNHMKGAEYLKRVQEINLAQRKKEIRDQQETTLITVGEGQLDKGNRAEARASFEQVAQLNPHNWSAHEYLAKMSLDSGDWRLAHEHLVKMQEIDSDSSEGNFLMAFYWYNQKDFNQALTFGERARSVQPNDAELRNLLGNIYLKLGDLEEASREYSAAVHLAPDRTDFKTNLQSLVNRNWSK
jgi:tetratricopeptide (TPR) repeat protein